MMTIMGSIVVIYFLGITTRQPITMTKLTTSRKLATIATESPLGIRVNVQKTLDLETGKMLSSVEVDENIFHGFPQQGIIEQKFDLQQQKTNYQTDIKPGSGNLKIRSQTRTKLRGSHINERISRSHKKTIAQPIGTETKRPLNQMRNNDLDALFDTTEYQSAQEQSHLKEITNHTWDIQTKYECVRMYALPVPVSRPVVSQGAAFPPVICIFDSKCDRPASDSIKYYGECMDINTNF